MLLLKKIIQINKHIFLTKKKKLCLFFSTKMKEIPLLIRFLDKKSSKPKFNNFNNKIKNTTSLQKLIFKANTLVQQRQTKLDELRQDFNLVQQQQTKLDGLRQDFNLLVNDLKILEQKLQAKKTRMDIYIRIITCLPAIYLIFALILTCL